MTANDASITAGSADDAGNPLAFLAGHLACPKCGGPIAYADNRMGCANANCASVYEVRAGIPIMLRDGQSPESEETGFYPKVRGGTMEDGPSPEFVAYDTKVRTRLLHRYLERDGSDGLLLDVCCSKAPFYPFLAEAGFRDRVFGADLLHHQLAEARSRGVRAVQANAVHLPFADAHFDRAIFTDALVHLLLPVDQEAVVAEIARVLKPGGKLYMTATSTTYADVVKWMKGTDPRDSDICTYYSDERLAELVCDYFTIESCDSFGFYYLLPGPLSAATGFFPLFDRLLNNPLTSRLGMVRLLDLRRR